MRTIVCLLLLGFWSATCRAQGYINIDPADSVNWLPVTIEAPPEFGSISSVRVRPNEASTGGDFFIPTAPYQFWIKRDLNPHPTHATWWTAPEIWLNSSPIGYGRNVFILHRDEALASSLVLRPQPEVIPPMTPPNDNGVGWARFWTVDDGTTPRDALASVDAVVVPEPSCALMTMMAIAAASRRLRRLTRQPG